MGLAPWLTLKVVCWSTTSLYKRTGWSVDLLFVSLSMNHTEIVVVLMPAEQAGPLRVQHARR